MAHKQKIWARPYGKDRRGREVREFGRDYRAGWSCFSLPRYSACGAVQFKLSSSPSPGFFRPRPRHLAPVSCCSIRRESRSVPGVRLPSPPESPAEYPWLSVAPSPQNSAENPGEYSWPPSSGICFSRPVETVYSMPSLQHWTSTEAMVHLSSVNSCA